MGRGGWGGGDTMGGGVGGGGGGTDTGHGTIYDRLAAQVVDGLHEHALNLRAQEQKCEMDDDGAHAVGMLKVLPCNKQLL